ncbi:hypothetical protein HHX47_DHR3000929 [Lentinula edodes]|nr:hypothetical protein HHX47_DHR3000929 [Lentinula edodes]
MPAPNEFFCNCARYCKARIKVSRTTYYAHAKFRLLQPPPQGDEDDEQRSRRRQCRLDDSNQGPVRLQIGENQQAQTPIDEEENQNEDFPPPDPPLPPLPPLPPPPPVLNELPPLALNPWNTDIQIAQLYINALRSIELDQSGLSEAALETLTHPPEHSIEFGDSDEEKDILFSLDLFIGLVHASEKEYTSSRAAVQRRYPSSSLLSYAQVKSQIASLTGIHPITHDMCPNTCMAYTGPFADHESCPRCDTSRYDLLTNRPRQQFYTLPLGPYIQTLYRDSKTAQLLGHFGERLQLLLEQVRRGEPIEEYDDICCGKDILEALSSEKISLNDVFLMVSMDGAQLYRMKASDCWMYIWILVGFSPNRHYKKKYVVPGGVIPGPDAPKITQSFLFPSLAHIAAVNKSGVEVLVTQERMAVGYGVVSRDVTRMAKPCITL